MRIFRIFSVLIELCSLFFAASTKLLAENFSPRSNRTLVLEPLPARELFAVFSCDVTPYGLVGTLAADTLNASAASENVVFGLGGNDRINVTVGAGRVCGGAGNDGINSGVWTADIAYGGEGNDVINGQWGNDVLFGDEGDDTIDGGANDDEIYGGPGSDKLYSGLGNDKLFGGDGDDILFPQGGTNILDGGDGLDTARVTGFSTEFDLFSNADGWQLVRKSKPTEINFLARVEFVQFQEKRVALPDELVGTAGDDVLTGTKTGRNLIRGLAGNDTIKVTAGFGEIYAGDGNDVVHAGVWSDDTVYGGNGNDKLNGQWGNDTLFGENGDDVINGGAGNDILDGGDGNDRLYGDYGNDTLLGGKGNDSLYPQLGTNVVDGGPDNDRLYLPGLYADFEILVEAEGKLVVSHVEGIVSATVTNVELVVFQDGTYDVQTGEFSLTPPTPPSGPNPPVTPLETVVPQSIVDSMLDVTAIQNAIVAVKVQNTHANNTASGYITFGHVFKQGDLPANFEVEARWENQEIETQTDVTTRYEDGSVKHAVLTVKIPALAPKSVGSSGLLDVVLLRTSQVTQTPSLSAADILNADFSLTADVSLSNGDGDWLVYASERDRTRPHWREELVYTRVNSTTPVEIRVPQNTDAFPVTVKATVYVNGNSEQVINQVVTVTPQNGVAKLDLANVLSGTIVDRVWISGTPAGTTMPAGIDLGNGTKTGLPVLDLRNLLAQSIANSSFSTWLSGPSVVEVRIEKELSPNLKARFDIRYFRDGTVRTNVIMLNETPAYSTGNRNVTYDITLMQGNESKLQFSGINHTRNSNWSEYVWNGTAPSLHVIQNAEYLLQTGAVPQYDLSLPVVIDKATYAGMIDNSLPFGPMKRGTVDNAMPGTGERSDIGPLPDWAVRFILTQDYRDLQVLVGNGRVSGSIAWHYVGNQDGNYISIKDHPNVWLESRGISSSFGKDALPKGMFDYRTNFIADLAHQPSLSFIPYIVTGDRYFADELTAQANWSLANVVPSNRQKSESKDLVFFQEVRGFGWTMRTLGEAAYVLPDSSPSKTYLTGVVNNNLQWLQNTYVDGTGPYESAPRGMLEGLFDNPWNDQSSKDAYGTASVWMNDYVAAALGTLSARGFENAESILNWQANVLAGRYIASDLGLQAFNGAIYQMPNTKSNDPLAKRGPTKPSDGFTFTTWSEVQAAIEAKGQNATQFSKWVSPGDYATKSMNGISAMMSYVGNVDAYEAYGFLAAGTHANRHAAIFSQQPRNSIQPVLSDGTLLVLTLQKMGGTGADQMAGSDASELLHGNEGNDIITGGAGVDLLYGGVGNDQLFGDDGDDYLFGNEGDDQLFGGKGNDILRGNVGADILDGGEGDDTLFYQGDDTVRGGLGTDTLALQSWRQAAIDLRSGKFSGIESIDLRNSPNQDVIITDTLVIDANAVATVSDTNAIVVRADSTDRVTLLGNPSRLADVTIGADRFAQYAKGESKIYVSLGTSVNGSAVSTLPPGEGEAQRLVADPFDVSGDQAVTPLDALLIINHLNGFASGSVSASANSSAGIWTKFDVDGNGRVSPLDVLLVINRMNSHFNESAVVTTAFDAEGEDSTDPLKRKGLASRVSIRVALVGVQVK